MRLDPQQMRAKDFPLVYKQFHNVSVDFLMWLKTRPTLASSQVEIDSGYNGGVRYTLKALLNFITRRESTTIIQVTSTIEGDEPAYFFVTASCDFRSYGVTYGLQFYPGKLFQNESIVFDVPGFTEIEFFIDKSVLSEIPASGPN